MLLGMADRASHMRHDNRLVHLACRRCRSCLDADHHSSKARDLELMHHAIYQPTYHDTVDRAVGGQLKAAQAEGSQGVQEEACQVN